jgi:hypothetical protein
VETHVFVVCALPDGGVIIAIAAQGVRIACLLPCIPEATASIAQRCLCSVAGNRGVYMRAAVHAHAHAHIYYEA